MGRKKLPDNVKKMRGTFQPCRSNPDAPVPLAGLPSAPAHLNEEERHQFETLVIRLDQINVASETDTEVITLAAKRLAEVIALSAILEDEGRVIESYNPKTEQTMTRSHPAVGQLNESLRHLHSLLAEMGLTPAARSKVTARQTKKINDRFQRSAP